MTQATSEMLKKAELERASKMLGQCAKILEQYPELATVQMFLLDTKDRLDCKLFSEEC